MSSQTITKAIHAGLVLTLGLLMMPATCLGLGAGVGVSAGGIGAGIGVHGTGIGIAAAGRGVGGSVGGGYGTAGIGVAGSHVTDGGITSSVAAGQRQAVRLAALQMGIDPREPDRAMAQAPHYASVAPPARTPPNDPNFQPNFQHVFRSTVSRLPALPSVRAVATAVNGDSTKTGAQAGLDRARGAARASIATEPAVLNAGVSQSQPAPTGSGHQAASSANQGWTLAAVDVARPDLAVRMAAASNRGDPASTTRRAAIDPPPAQLPVIQGLSAPAADGARFQPVVEQVQAAVPDTNPAASAKQASDPHWTMAVDDGGHHRIPLLPAAIALMVLLAVSMLSLYRSIWWMYKECPRCGMLIQRGDVTCSNCGALAPVKTHSPVRPGREHDGKMTVAVEHHQTRRAVGSH